MSAYALVQKTERVNSMIKTYAYVRSDLADDVMIPDVETGEWLSRSVIDGSRVLQIDDATGDTLVILKDNSTRRLFQVDLDFVYVNRES